MFEETYNPRIPTGTIEMEAHEVEVLGRVYQPLPFEIMTSKSNPDTISSCLYCCGACGSA